MTVSPPRQRRYDRERAYGYFVKPVEKVDKPKVTKERFREMMQKGLVRA